MVKKPGPPEVLQVKEIDEPLLRRDTVLARVHATALNRADLLQRRGLYAPPPGVRGDILGLEFAGVVEKTGAGTSRFKPGDRVMGLIPGEAYAEKASVPETLLMPVPDRLNLLEAAALPETFITAYDALRQLEFQTGEMLLIHAVASGVGLAGVQLAKSQGATVCGTSRSLYKLLKCKDIGLDVGIQVPPEDFESFIRDHTSGKGVPAILDLVVGTYWNQSLRSLSPRGRLILVGLLGGSKAETPLDLVLQKRLRIIGTSLRTRSLQEKSVLVRDFTRDILPLFETGKLRPVIDRVLPIEQAGEAHALMESNQNFGKIILNF
ncbi:MAG: NAD(P)H-quinone oxidoreductase [Acidobacteria bacterium]|nr:NAD(P)H-quinone oxidoreductase [Acidobacteriota bacterium]